MAIPCSSRCTDTQDAAQTLTRGCGPEPVSKKNPLTAAEATAALAAASAVGKLQSYTPHLPRVPVGARLRFFARVWATTIADPWCTSVVTHGYYPEMEWTSFAARAARPAAACVLDPVKEVARATMVEEMRVEEVIEPVGSPLNLFSQEPQRGHWPILPSVYSTYFLVPKSDGGWRGCLDSRYTNEYVRSIYFKMDSLRTLRDMCSPGDWMVKLDLRHAYLVCPIHPFARPAFRFRAQGDWQFRTVCFGLRSAPRVFTRLLKPVFALLRRLGVRCMSFIDDVAILGHTPMEAVRHGMMVVDLLTSLGFILHAVKSDLVPRQSDGEFLGAVCDFRPSEMCFRLPGKKRRDLRRCCRRLLSMPRPVSPRELSTVLGKFVAARMMVEIAALHSRGLERDLKQALILSKGEWDSRCWTLSTEAMEDLVWWIALLGNPTRCRMFLLEHETSIDVDASPWGFGGFWGSMVTGGFWGLKERSGSQNAREMRAVELTLRTFVRFLRGRSLLVLSDSAVVVCYLNRQGGRFPGLSRAAERILRWCVMEKIAIRCTHLPGVLNTRADIRSRWGETMAEYKLCPAVLRRALTQLQYPWPTLDLFAARHNRQCEKYFSMRLEPESLGVNAMNQIWPARAVLYAFPPVALLTNVVSKLRTAGLQAILITPAFGGAWYPLVMEMALHAPILLPAKQLFLGLDGLPRESPRFRTLLWVVRGQRPLRLTQQELRPVDLLRSKPSL